MPAESGYPSRHLVAVDGHDGSGNFGNAPLDLDTSGNMIVAGTLNVTGVTTLTGGLAAGDVAGPTFSSYTPTVTPGSGAYTTVTASGNVMRVGKMVTVNVTINYTDIGTGGTFTSFSLPTAPAGAAVFVGVEQLVSGRTLIAYITGAGSPIFRFTGDSSPFVPSSGAQILATGTYQSV